MPSVTKIANKIVSDIILSHYQRENSPKVARNTW